MSGDRSRKILLSLVKKSLPCLQTDNLMELEVDNIEQEKCDQNIYSIEQNDEDINKRYEIPEYAPDHKKNADRRLKKAREHYMRSILTLQVLFITDLVSFERPENGRLFETIIDDIKNHDIHLYVIGLSIDPPKTIFKTEDIKNWMSTVEMDEKNSNLKVMKKIVDKTPHSVMCNYEVGVNLFHSFKYCKGMQPWTVPLTFGTLLHLPASTIRIAKREPPFRLQSSATRNFNVKWVYENQQDVELDFYDTVSGIVKHGKFVHIQSEGRFKIEGPRSFRALGFTESKHIPEYFMQSDGSNLVIPDPKQSEYFEFFSALVDEVASSNLCLIGRRVYNKDFNPKFVVLIPRPDFNIKCFIMCNLPYADDIAHEYEEQDIESAPKVDADEKIFSFLESIDVSSDKCQIKVPLAPGMMVYNSALGIINKVVEKSAEAIIEKKVDTDVELPNSDDLKTEWPVREIEKTQVKKEESTLTDFDDVGDFIFS